jgi:hypothetical protein
LVDFGDFKTTGVGEFSSDFVTNSDVDDDSDAETSTVTSEPEPEMLPTPERHVQVSML